MTDLSDRLSALLEQAERVLDRLDKSLGVEAHEPDWGAAVAFRWRRRGARRGLVPVRVMSTIRLSDLQGVDDQKRNDQRIDHGRRGDRRNRRAREKGADAIVGVSLG